MPDAAELLVRLRDDPRHLEGLVDAGITFALKRPLDTWLDPEDLVARITRAIQAAATQDGLAAWLAERIERTLSPLDAHRGVLGERIPMTALAPLEKSLRREVAPDPHLVRALLDHASLRALMRDILSANLTEFAKRLRDSMPVPGRAASRGLGRAFAGVAKGMASAAGAAVERQLDDRVKAFVDDAIGVSIETTIDRFCGPTHQADMAQWRVDVLHAVLQQPIERIVSERKKIPAADVAEDAVAIVRVLADWSDLPGAVEDALAGVLWRDGDLPTAEAWLAGSGLNDELRSAVRANVLRDARVFIEEPAFAAWLGEWVDGA